MFVERTITAQNQFTTPVLKIPPLTDPQKKTGFNISISGTFDATVSLQRRFTGTVTWLDVETFTTPGEFIGDEVESNTEYQIGVKTGDFVSGPVKVRLGVN